MSNILKGIINEAHYPEDPDEYEAMFGARRRSNRMEPDEPQEPYNPWDEHYRRQDAAQAKYNKEVKVEYSDKEGVAPNGERYNSMFVVRASNPYQGDNEIRKFEDLHWGAKKIVDTVKKETKDVNQSFLTAVYYVDNHKYGMWRPWKDEPPTQKPLTFENPVEHFGQVLEGISQEDLANTLCHRIEIRYPDIYKKYDYDAMYNAVDDVASFHAGAEELGSSDINMMIRQVFKRLEESEGVAEGYKEPTDAAGHAKMAAKIKKMLDDTLADRGDRHGNPDPQRLTRAYEYHMEKAREKSQGVGEQKGTLWRVHQSEATGRYHVVKGYNKDLKIWKNKMGAGDFNSKDAAQAKADELNKGIEEGWKQNLAAASAAGLMALGGGGAHAGGVTLGGGGHTVDNQIRMNQQMTQQVQQQAPKRDLSGFATEYLQKAADPNRFGRFLVSPEEAKAELAARESGTSSYKEPQKPAPSANNGFSKEYLEKAADPNRFGRYLISIEKAQELLKQMNATNEDQLEEIDRRGFLRGAGAAAIAGAAGNAMAGTSNPNQEYVTLTNGDKLPVYNSIRDVAPHMLGQFINTKNEKPLLVVAQDGKKYFLFMTGKDIRGKLIRSHGSGISEDNNELKCWDGYKRVPGTKAGDPGSCEEIEEGNSNELSTDLLARYKTAAGADARAADKAGNFARGNTRFAGIVKATKKQFDNETRTKKESAIMKGIQNETLGTPYPGTYEQENKPFMRKGQERTMKIAFEGKNALKRY